MSSNAEHARADRPAPTNPARDNDAWTDDVADRVQAILREEGLELELVVFYDSLTEVLRAPLRSTSRLSKRSCLGDPRRCPPRSTRNRVA